MTTTLNTSFQVNSPFPAQPQVASPIAQFRRQSAESAQFARDTGQADRGSILHVRPVSLADIPPLLRLPGTLRLDVPDSVVANHSESIELPAALPMLRRDRPTFVATADGHPVGFVRFSPRSPDERWVVTAIAASTGVYSPEPVWEGLLEHGVRSAGLRGVRRLYARVPVGHRLLQTMLEAGWVAYSRETVFRAERMVAVGRAPQQLRLQEPADTWAIHQLYAAATPRQVQEIEALTSHVWHMDERRRPRNGVRKTGWLLDDGNAIRAYARFTRGPRAGMVDALVSPGRREEFGSLLDGVITAGKQSRPVYCALRAYLLDCQDELTQRGFVAIGEQETLIRYTTATVRAPISDPVHFPVELRPALPQRAPTFLEGQ